MGTIVYHWDSQFTFRNSKRFFMPIRKSLDRISFFPIPLHQIKANLFLSNYDGYVHGFDFWSGSYGSIWTTNIFVSSKEVIDYSHHFSHSRQTIVALRKKCIAIYWRNSFSLIVILQATSPYQKSGVESLFQFLIPDDNKSFFAELWKFCTKILLLIRC